MFGLKRIVVAQYERGILLRNRTVQTVLEPGVHWLFDPLRRCEVQTYNLNHVEFAHDQIDFMVKNTPHLCERYFTVVDLKSHQVGLLYLNDVLNGILAPGQRYVFWKEAMPVRVEVLDIDSQPQVPDPVARLLVRTRNPRLLREMSDAVYAVTVDEYTVGLLYVDGRLQQVLQPGTYGFWRFNRGLQVTAVDARIQVLEVNGQEILSKDKVSLRVNLTAQYQVTDPVQAQARLSDVKEFFYRELQLVLRQVIGTRALDTLLSEKGELDKVIFNTAETRMAEFGLRLHSVGVKDIILPGEMKTILNQVVEAEKAAKRREETAATRSLLNTAKLMEANPILLRLKELEALEKITDKVDRLTVFGGLDGVLKDTVKIQLPAT